MPPSHAHPLWNPFVFLNIILRDGVINSFGATGFCGINTHGFLILNLGLQLDS